MSTTRFFGALTLIAGCSVASQLGLGGKSSAPAQPSPAQPSPAQPAADTTAPRASGDAAGLPAVPAVRFTDNKAENCTPTCYKDEAVGSGENPCGAPKLACEGGGSKTARGENMIHFRVDEAKHALAAGDKTTCYTAAWVALGTVVGVKDTAKDAKRTGMWTEGLKYRTRWDGTLGEAALFAKIDDQNAEAAKLYADCGGPNPMPQFMTSDKLAYQDGGPVPQQVYKAVPKSQQSVELHNRDNRFYDFECRCNGAINKSGAVGMGTNYDICYPKCDLIIIADQHTIGKLRSQGGEQCELSGGALVCE